MSDTSAPPRFIFLDLETTGLEAGVDQITEAAWITDEGKEYQFIVRHDRFPSEWVAQNTDYGTRILTAREKWPLRFVLDELANCCKQFGGTVYMVGACPAFDDRFLRLAYGEDNVPYHYHVIDIEAMAFGRFSYPEPCSLAHLRELLGLPGENEAPHSALFDAREVKLIFDALRSQTKNLTTA